MTLGNRRAELAEHFLLGPTLECVFAKSIQNVIALIASHIFAQFLAASTEHLKHRLT